jgi:hypothetical protein
MPPQPELPEPAHHDVDSMLSRKFGKEVANYFSGSPLNRVSFLRPNHDFISKALTHPTTSFLLFNDLSPLAKDPSKLAYATHTEVKPLIGENPFAKTEEELIKEYNSDITLPLVLFLGLDERKKDGFEHGIYKGTPYFAVDVTPKGTVEKEATGVIEAMKAKGLTFIEGRMHMSLNAPEGRVLPHFTQICTHGLKLRSMPKPAPSSIGTLEIPSAEAAANPHYPSTQAQSVSALQQTTPPFPHRRLAERPQRSLANEPHAPPDKAYPTSASHEQILLSSWQL